MFSLSSVKLPVLFYKRKLILDENFYRGTHFYYDYASEFGIQELGSMSHSVTVYFLSSQSGNFNFFPLDFDATF